METTETRVEKDYFHCDKCDEYRKKLDELCEWIAKWKSEGLDNVYFHKLEDKLRELFDDM